MNSAILHWFLIFKLHALTFKPCISAHNLSCTPQNLMTRLEFLTNLANIIFSPSPHQSLISPLKIWHYCNLIVFFFSLFFDQEPRYHYQDWVVFEVFDVSDCGVVIVKSPSIYQNLKIFYSFDKCNETFLSAMISVIFSLLQKRGQLPCVKLLGVSN